MNINKERAAMIFGAIVELNSVEQVVELIGEEKVSEVVKVMADIAENTTPRQAVKQASELLLVCCDILLDSNDDDLPTRLEGSD